MEEEIKLEFSQEDLANMLFERVKNNSKDFKSGTYSRADPTHYESYSATFGLEYGYFFKAKPENMRPENVTISVYDCTWGVKVTVRLSEHKKIYEGQWSRGLGGPSQWINCTKGLMRILHDVMLNGNEEDFWAEKKIPNKRR